MPTWDPGLPGWADFLLILIVAALVGGGSLWSAIQGRRARHEVQAVAAQVTNTHTTNLRDDIDRALVGVAAVANTARRSELLLEKLSESLASTEAALHRRLDIQARQMDRLLEAQRRESDDLDRRLTSLEG